MKISDIYHISRAFFPQPACVTIVKQHIIFGKLILSFLNSHSFSTPVSTYTDRTLVITSGFYAGGFKKCFCKPNSCKINQMQVTEVTSKFQSTWYSKQCNLFKFSQLCCRAFLVCTRAGSDESNLFHQQTMSTFQGYVEDIWQNDRMSNKCRVKRITPTDNDDDNETCGRLTVMTKPLWRAKFTNAERALTYSFSVALIHCFSHFRSSKNFPKKAIFLSVDDNPMNAEKCSALSYCINQINPLKTAVDRSRSAIREWRAIFVIWLEFLSTL